MSRLDEELNRLWLGGLVFAPLDAQALSLVDARGRVRALVLEVVQPTGWDALSRAWNGVQAEAGRRRRMTTPMSVSAQIMDAIKQG